MHSLTTPIKSKLYSLHIEDPCTDEENLLNSTSVILFDEHLDRIRMLYDGNSVLETETEEGYYGSFGRLKIKEVNKNG